MLKIYPKANSGISLGRSGEENARQICFDISGWRELYGEGVVQLLHQRTSDADPYPVDVTVDGDAVLWTVTLADTSEPGHGKAELQYRVGDTVAKSVTWATFVGASLGTPTDTPPEAQQGWVDKVLAAGASAENAAQRAEDAAERAEDAGVSDADVAKAVADYLAENPVNAEVSQEQIEEAVRDYILENPIEGGVTDEQIAAAVEDYLTKNPIEGGITEETDPTVPNWAKTALTAEVGQYFRVSAVDDNGVVTAVETVDAPSGGGAGAEWELINEITTAEEVVSVEITTDTDGHPFDLLECEVSISIPSAPATAAAWYFYFTPGTTNYFMRTLTAVAQQIIVRYNTLSNVASLAAQYSSGSVSVGAWAMKGHAVTEFRMKNWDSVALPVGTVVRLIGRRKT